MVLAVLWLFQVGHELGEGVTAVKVGGIPSLILVKCPGLAQLGLGLCDLHERQLLGGNGLTKVGLVDVLQHDLHRRAVHDDVVVIQKQVIVLLVAHEIDMEQAAAVQVKRHHEPALFLLDVLNVLDCERPRLIVHVERLNGLTVIVQRDAGEQGGVGLECGLDSSKQALAVKGTIQHIDIGEIVKGFAFMAGAFNIYTELGG